MVSHPEPSQADQPVCSAAVGWMGCFEALTIQDMTRSEVSSADRLLLSGNEAIALAARHAGVALGSGYPGTSSTEILESFARYGGRAQWSPNEKTALEVCIGVAYGGGRALATMKHVGLNVAADPLFTVAYTGVTGALVVVSADDPGMASSQNEQDNRRYAVAAGLPMVEPSDSQEAYDFFRQAIEISERWRIPVLFRVTTRVCHSKSVLRPAPVSEAPPKPDWVRDVRGRVMIPAYARLAHRRLRQKLAEIAVWNEAGPLNVEHRSGNALGIIASGVSYLHAREAAPDASMLKLGMTHPLPIERLRSFAASVERCVVLEEGDPYLVDALRASGMAVEGKAEMYRYGEFNVARVRRILAGDTTAEVALAPGKPPQLCDGCAYRQVFGTLHKLQAIVAGDIGCYTLGALAPFEAMDTCVCMGASLGVGLGLRHVLPSDQAKRVVSLIGDSTFVHSGISGLVEMVYNPPPGGHVLIILDNSTTAMTGHQEHPGTGRRLDHQATGKVVFEDLARSLGVRRVHVVEPRLGSDDFERVLVECFQSGELAVIIVRRPCILIARQLKEYERQQEEHECPCACEIT
jgi:indolepyruvate ferredoxin oxidoreductase alpha subunit